MKRGSKIKQPASTQIVTHPDVGSPHAEFTVPEKATKEKAVRKGLIFLGVLILAYIYSNSLLAQQASKQRISVSQAVDFPNDI